MRRSKANAEGEKRMRDLQQKNKELMPRGMPPASRSNSGVCLLPPSFSQAYILTMADSDATTDGTQNLMNIVYDLVCDICRSRVISGEEISRITVCGTYAEDGTCYMTRRAHSPFAGHIFHRKCMQHRISTMANPLVPECATCGCSFTNADVKPASTGVSVLHGELPSTEGSTEGQLR